MADKSKALSQKLQQFLSLFRGCELCETWTTTPALTLFVEEIQNLAVLTKTASEGADARLDADQAEAIKTARLVLLNKKAYFCESITLFPLGQYIQQAANTCLESHLRDIALAKDLDSCITAAAEMKAFSVETVCKGDAMELFVPGQSKVVDVQMRRAMIESTASQRFKEAHASKLSLVDLKFEELATALRDASSAKFRTLAM